MDFKVENTECILFKAFTDLLILRSRNEESEVQPFMG